MTQPHDGVRGPGRSRGGATDTTMLIWKVVEANPGINRAGIWEKVEHGIPEGYALRAYAQSGAPRKRSSRESTVLDLCRARGFVLTLSLQSLRRTGRVTAEGVGRDRRYAVISKPTYKGNLDAVDETGSKAADHMALADALRTVEKLLARNPYREHGPALMGTRKEKEAVALLAEAVRAKNGG